MCIFMDLFLKMSFLNEITIITKNNKDFLLMISWEMVFLLNNDLNK